jgi:hypothetical protein
MTLRWYFRQRSESIEADIESDPRQANRPARSR